MEPTPSFKTLADLMSWFNEESRCYDYLKGLIWKSGTPESCPRCKHTKFYTLKGGKTFKCTGCKKKFNLFTNTIFENTKIPLHKWVIAIFLSCTQKRGISSHQLVRYIGTSQKTSWFVLQRIRSMFEALRPETLEGICVADETYVGGKEKNKHKDKKTWALTRQNRVRGESTKLNVVGILQIGGMVKSTCTPKVTKDILVPLIIENVKQGSTMMTDEWQGYRGLAFFFDHHTCDHQSKQFVGETGGTTNPIENYWSSIKRAIQGNYYHISKKHIQRYLHEFDYKYNFRLMTDADRFRMTLEHLPNTRLKYKDLTANGKTETKSLGDQRSQGESDRRVGPDPD